MSKFYIAGKVTGLKNYKEHFSKAEGFPWEIYMPICYAMIDACDSIYLLKNWIDSKGAKLELEYAKSKNKTIIFEISDTI